MINKNVLGGTLFLQLVVAAALYFSHAGGAGNTATPLVATGDVSKVVITDGKSTATLAKSGDKWQVDKQDADNGKITSMLDTLGKLKVSVPVAGSASGRERFEVTEQKFQRHVTLFAGDKQVGDLYFGTSPGFRQSHVRRAGDDNVYAVAFNNYDLGVMAGDWVAPPPPPPPSDKPAEANPTPPAGNK